MSAPVGRLAKPQLRGHVKDYLKKHLIFAVTGALGVAFAWKYLVAEPRKRAYAEFYRTYDVEWDSERMSRLGLFHGFNEVKGHGYEDED